MNFLNRLTSLLLLLTLLMVSGAINAESASGLQNLSSGLYQGTSSFNLLMHQGKSGFSYDGALGSSVVTKGADKWSRAPKSIQDQMTLKAAQEGQGNVIIKNLNDPNFKGMEKMELKVKSANGNDSVVHYVRDPKTGDLMDFKFKKHSTDGLNNIERVRDPRKGTY